MNRYIYIFFLFVISVCSQIYAADSCQENTLFNIGAGVYDITGPAAEEGMMGYAMIKQQTAGIYQRLWARAFVIESPCNGKRVIFVNADLGQLFQGVKQQVIKKLQQKYGERYNDQNVLLTATHTHSGPGGYSTYTLYNLSTLGFSREHFNTIVNGIVSAIDRAEENIAPAHIHIASGIVNGVSFNRSPQSYLLNPLAERELYPQNVDTQMTLIRFDRLDGQPIGMINWFPLHGVSLNNKNHLISGDNKGYAAYLFEKDFYSDYGPKSFVAAFAQANAGDVSPNPYGKEGGEGLTGIAAVEKTGKAQYEIAKLLFDRASELVHGGVDYRHKFVKMDQLEIEPQYTDGQPHITCPAAIGISMLAGTTDGEGVGAQGVTCGTLGKVIPGLFCEGMTTPCQGIKPIALQMGLKKPNPWVPQVLPFQVFKLGNLFIAAAPFELTTMTGRRIRSTIESQISRLSNHHIVLSALANAYASYVATHEEYQLQRYEGASTYFGPWEQAALQQEFSKLTKALILDQPVNLGPTPSNLLEHQINFQPGVLFDDKPPLKQFGDLYSDVHSVYHAGDRVEAIFYGGHPKNNYHVQDSFLEVQHLDHDKWRTIRLDRDWDTEYHWRRYGVSYSLITIVWRTDSTVQPGYYRMVHHGDWKAFGSGKITPYTGYSTMFQIK